MMGVNYAARGIQHSPKFVCLRSYTLPTREGVFMKIRRTLVAVGAAVAVATAGTPAASAAQAPEPLASVLTQIANTAGYEAQNVILVPAALSSLGFLSNLLFN